MPVQQIRTQSGYRIYTIEEILTLGDIPKTIASFLNDREIEILKQVCQSFDKYFHYHNPLAFFDIFDHVTSFLDHPTDMANVKKACPLFNKYLMNRNPNTLPTHIIARYTQNSLEILNKKRDLFTKLLNDHEPLDMVELHRNGIKPQTPYLNIRFEIKNVCPKIASYLIIYGLLMILPGIMLITTLDSDSSTTQEVFGIMLTGFGVVWLLFNFASTIAALGVNPLEATYNLMRRDLKNGVEEPILAYILLLLMLVTSGPTTLLPDFIRNPAYYFENKSREEQLTQVGIDKDKKMRTNIVSTIEALFPLLTALQTRIENNELLFMEKTDKTDKTGIQISISELMTSLKNYHDLLIFNKLPEKENPAPIDEQTPLLGASPKEEDISIQPTFPALNTIETLQTLRSKNTEINETIDAQFKNINEILIKEGFFKPPKTEETTNENIFVRILKNI